MYTFALQISFEMSSDSHYHIPLLLNRKDIDLSLVLYFKIYSPFAAFGYSTYRGSWAFAKEDNFIYFHDNSDCLTKMIKIKMKWSEKFYLNVKMSRCYTTVFNPLMSLWGLRIEPWLCIRLSQILARFSTYPGFIDVCASWSAFSSQFGFWQLQSGFVCVCWE